MYNNNLWVELKKHLKESTLQALIAQQNQAYGYKLQ